MSFNDSLVRLDLSHQLKKKIGADGAIHIAKALRVGACKSSLKCLKLARSHIGFEGCRHLSGALLMNTGLTDLDISGNNFITVEGAMQLAIAIVHNPSLEWLGVGKHNLNIKCLRGTINIIDLKKQQLRAKQMRKMHHQSSYRLLGKTETILDVSEATEEDHNVAVEALHRIMKSKPILRVGRKEDDMSSWEFWGIDLEHKTTVKTNSMRDISVTSNEDDESNNKIERWSKVEDETAILIAYLLQHNRLHENVCVQQGVLPLQQLIGLQSATHVDVSNKGCTSCDAIIIGKILAENNFIKCISLHGNLFSATEGENWIAYALNRNPSLKIDSASWTPEKMYTDGYKSLAALNGTSASGLAMEPLRLDNWLYKGFIIGGAIMFYVGIIAEINTVIIYSTQPDIYNTSWVYLGAIFICLPTFLIITLTCITLIKHDPIATLKKSVLVLFQLSKVVETWNSVVIGMETADCKY